MIKKSELRFVLDQGSSIYMLGLLRSFIGSLRFRSTLTDSIGDLNRYEFVVTGYDVKQKHFIEQCVLLFRHGCISR